MLKIITAVFTVLTLLLLLVTGFTLWGTLAFLLAAAALVGVCFFGEKLSGKMAFIGVAVAAASFLVSALFGAPGMPHFDESAQSDVLMTEENQGDNDLWDSVVAADIDRMILDGKYDEAKEKISDLPYCDDRSVLEGKLLLAQEEYYSAIPCFNRVENKNEECYSLLIEAMYRQNKGKVDASLCSKAQDAAYDCPFDPYLMYFAGYSCYETDQYVQAAYYLSKTLEMEPENPYANYYYALTAYALGYTEQATAFLDYAGQCAQAQGGLEDLLVSIETYKKLMEEGKQ